MTFPYIQKTIYLLSFYLFCNSLNAQYLGRKDYKELTNDSFKEQINITGEELLIPGLNLINPRKIIVLSKYLLIYDRDAKKNIHIVDLMQNKYLGLYLGLGEGPNELDSIFSLEKIDENSFIAYSAVQEKYLCFEINDLLNSSTPFASGHLKGKKYPRFVNYDKDRNVLFSVGGLNKQDYLIYEHHLDSGKIIGHEEPLKPDSGLDAPEIRFHLSNGPVSSQHGNFAFTYMEAPLIEFFDYNTKKLKSVVIPHKQVQKYHAEYTDGTLYVGSLAGEHIQFEDIILTDQYIYAEYVDMKIPFDDKNIKNPVLYVLDYELNPIKMYHLDTGGRQIAIDKNKRLYTVYDDKILVYQLEK